MLAASLHIDTPSSIQVLTHRTASDFLNAAWPALSKRETAANLILPCALQRLSLERAIQTILDDGDQGLPSSTHDFHVQSKAPCVSANTLRAGSSDGYLWFTCWTQYEGGSPCLDIILSCTEGSLGPQPIFLWSSLASSQTSREHMDPRISKLIEKLSATVPITRVFSVFGPTPLTKTFAKQWSDIAGVTQITEPLYVEKLLFTTKERLGESPPLPPGDDVRLGSSQDIPAIGKLCKDLSETSVHYPLSLDEAIREATELVFDHQVWVYETDGGCITAILAVDSISPTVATITRLYTFPTRRNRGCAERLTRIVSREMLYSLGKQRVAFYVKNGSLSEKVCDSLGFIGPQGEEVKEEIEEFIEIGFNGVPRGHW